MQPKRRKSAEKAPKPKPAYMLVILPALILIGALALRSVSLKTFPPLVDENITKDVVTAIWHGDLSNNWKNSVTAEDYRIDLYNFSSYMYFDAAIAGTAAKLAGPDQDGSIDFVYWSRLLSAILGTLAAGLFFLVAHRLFG